MPFGEEIASSVGGRTPTQGYGQNDNARQKFTGYEGDEEIGLDYAQNRYFSNKQGRFTSIDPLAASANIKNPQTLNRYSYSMNSPYKFTDPSGLIASDWDASKKGFSQEDNDWDWRSKGIGSQTASAEKQFDDDVQNTSDMHEDGVVIPGLDPSQYTVTSTPLEVSNIQTDFFLQLWDLHAGAGNAYVDPRTGLPVPGFDHQCSINMSVALQRMGIDMSSYTGTTVDVPIDGTVYKGARSADQLAAWLIGKPGQTALKSHIGGPMIAFNNQKWNNLKGESGKTDEFLNGIVGKRGIVVSLDSWRDPKSGRIGAHIDLFNVRVMRRQYETNNLLTTGKSMYFIQLR